MSTETLPVHLALSGDLIVQFRRPDPANLSRLKRWIEGSAHLLADAPVPVEALIRSLSWTQITNLEAMISVPASLNSLYRVRLRLRELTVEVLQLVAAELRARRPVATVYLEQAVSLPTSWRALGFAPDQRHLQPSPEGTGARTFWASSGGAGEGSHLYDLEHGWASAHPDLASLQLGAPLFGDNEGAHLGAAPGLAHGPALDKANIAALRRVNHGTAALGVAVSLPVAAGRVGVAPQVGAVSLVSAYDRTRDTGEDVASAILAALFDQVANSRVRCVLLLEVQRGWGLPTEVDLGDFLAIRLAVQRGVVVVEAAGNGGCDLDEVRWPDSGAIVVGASADAAPYTPLGSSNRGRRVNLFAQGEGVLSSGSPLDHQGVPSFAAMATQRRADFGKTSGAAAIAAGMALDLLGRAGSLGRSPSPLDIRRWLVSSSGTDRRPDLGQLPDAALVVQGKSLSGLSASSKNWPWRKKISYALNVTNPQTGEGNTNVVDSSGGTIGFVRLEPLPGTGLPHCTAGSSPPTTGANDPAWVEHWVLPDKSALLDPPDEFSFEYDAGNTTTNPNGAIWGPTVIAYFKGRADYNSNWRSAEMSFKYAAIPASFAQEPDLNDAGVTIRHYKIERVISGQWTKVGELRRRIDGTQVRDRWMLDDNYRFANAGKSVRMTRTKSAESTSTLDWLNARYTASTGTTSPKPKWYVNTETSVVAF